ncbi:MAG: hypothetical protein HQL33_08465 [Alphaproteobacteria bacterium]|nr:hypothetical protein [Alphaproteobacteria bacterium]MBF0130013.1 hypothetical protein [Alphaproteobacteria bacterium]
MAVKRMIRASVVFTARAQALCFAGALCFVGGLCLVGSPAAAAPVSGVPLPPVTTAPPPAILLETAPSGPSLWESAKDAISSAGSMLVPPTPGDFAHSLSEKERSDFWKLLDDAGYALQEVETSVGLIPGLSTTFTLVRELSESDREWIEREMEQYASRDGSVIARMQRSILNVLLEASEMGNFKIETLEVILLPLPKAKFHLTPTVNVRGGDQDALYRMLESIDKKIR